MRHHVAGRHWKPFPLSLPTLVILIASQPQGMGLSLAVEPLFALSISSFVGEDTPVLNWILLYPR